MISEIHHSSVHFFVFFPVEWGWCPLGSAGSCACAASAPVRLCVFAGPSGGLSRGVCGCSAADAGEAIRAGITVGGGLAAEPIRAGMISLRGLGYGMIYET